MVLVPGILGSIFQLTLDGLWISTSNLNADSQAQNENVVELTAAFKHLVLYGCDQLTSAFEEIPAAGKRAIEDRERLLQCAEKIRVNAGPGGLQSAELVKASLMFCNIMRDLEKVTASMNPEQFSNNTQRFASYANVMKTALVVSSQIQTTVSKQSQFQAVMRKQQDFLNGSIRSLILWSFAITALVTLVLVIGFVKTVLFRLEQLAANARALVTSGKQLFEISGHDELTYLDSVFHDVAHQLQRAREHHQLIMQMVAHDLRSPIMATQVYIDVFQELVGDGLTDKARQWCHAIETSSNQVLTFVTELLTLESAESNSSNLNFSYFNIAEMIDECKASLSVLAAQKTIAIVNNCDDLTVLADRARVLHVSMNFLSNAVKFSPAGANVRVSNETDGNGSVTVFVDDDGPGLSRNMQARVFDKYFQGAKQNNASSGFGLGLSICKMLIESHKGNVGVNSEPGTGSQFWYSLPNRIVQSQSEYSNVDAPGIGYLLTVLRKPGLVRRGLVLTILPFVAQGVWLVWMNAQLSTSENLERLERTQSDLVTAVNRLWLCTFDANTSLTFFIFCKEDHFRTLAQRRFSQVKESLGILDTLATSDVDTMNTWRETRSFVINETDRLDKVLKDSANQRESGELVGLSQGFSPLDLLVGRGGSTEAGDQKKVFLRTQLLVNRIEDMQRAELKRLSEVRQQRASFLHDIQGLIFAAIAINMLMYVVLWLLFIDQLSKRLDLLVDCAKKIPTRQPVLSPVVGKDELASLGDQLQRASVDLKEADDQRQAMMNMVAHDIRAPLMTVEVALTMLETKCSPLPLVAVQSADSLRSARANVERVLALVNDLLTLDKLEAGMIELEPSDCSCAVLVDEAVSSIESLALTKGISIERKSADIVLHIDKGRMIQVLVNILANAIKFSPANSVIKIKAERISTGLRISIQDSGQGMDAETAEHVFERYYKSGNQNEAAFGLGLAICKLIIDAHGGKIGISSAPGEGSTFWLVLPLKR
jgi:signal transduction histidine kinase